MYDVDDKHNVDDVDKQKLIGTMECTLGDIVAAGDHLTKSLNLKGSFLPIFVLYLGLSTCHCGLLPCTHFSHLFTHLSFPDRPSGDITVQVKEASEDFKVVIDFELSAKRLDKKDFFGKVSLIEILPHMVC